MDCDQVQERLPWYGNGTLPGPERAAVEDHLVTCGVCKAEWAGTIQAFEVHSAHFEPEALVALAFGQPVPNARVLEAHLKTCAACAEEFRLVQASRASISEPAGRRPNVAPWAAAVAASLILGLGAAYWFERTQWNHDRQSWIAEKERLLAQIGQAAQPQPNTVTLDLMPLRSLTRGSVEAVRGIRPLPGQGVTFILNSQESIAGGTQRLRIIDAGGKEIWHVSGLVRNPTGDYTITFPPGFAGPGVYTIEISSDVAGAAVERYSIRILPPPPTSTKGAQK